MSKITKRFIISVLLNFQVLDEFDRTIDYSGFNLEELRKFIFTILQQYGYDTTSFGEVKITRAFDEIKIIYENN